MSVWTDYEAAVESATGMIDGRFTGTGKRRKHDTQLERGATIPKKTAHAALSVVMGAAIKCVYEAEKNGTEPRETWERELLAGVFRSSEHPRQARLDEGGTT